MSTPEQQARELIGRACLASLVGKKDEHLELANLIEERVRLRAGIEAALVEIERQRQDPGAFDYPATIAWEQASDAAADIVRKHTTGVK